MRVRYEDMRKGEGTNGKRKGNYTRRPELGRGRPATPVLPLPVLLLLLPGDIVDEAAAAILDIFVRELILDVPLPLPPPDDDAGTLGAIGLRDTRLLIPLLLLFIATFDDVGNRIWAALDDDDDEADVTLRRIPPLTLPVPLLLLLLLPLPVRVALGGVRDDDVNDVASVNFGKLTGSPDDIDVRVRPFLSRDELDPLLLLLLVTEVVPTVAAVAVAAGDDVRAVEPFWFDDEEDAAFTAP
jgi:hypothetical protein